MRLPLLGLPALLLFPGVALAGDVWTVGPTGQFPTITAALGFAQTDDRILVSPGTYDECLSIAQTVRILATEGSAETVLTCNNAARPYAIDVLNGFEVRLAGFTIAHGAGFGGIRSNGSAVMLRDVKMDGMISTTGAACLDVTNGNATLYDVDLFGCTGTTAGAIRFSSSAGHSLTVVGSAIDDADATGNGGGISFSGGALVLAESSITNSHAAGVGGGVYATSSTPIQLRGVEISGSSAKNGGALYFSGAYGQVTESKFTSNSALYNNTQFSGGEGGAIYAAGGVSVTHSEFSDNFGSLYGAGLYSTTSASVTGTTMSRNVVGVASAYVGQGGAVFMSTGILTSSGVRFEDNAAVSGYGGAIFAPGGWTSRDDILVRNGKQGSSTVTGYGGAAYAASPDVRYSRFTDNAATAQGGALYGYGNGTITGVRFNTNRTGSLGGALYISSGSWTLANDVWAGNISNGGGGALGVSTSSLLSITGGKFDSNRAEPTVAGPCASCDGGAIYMTSNNTSSYGLSITTTWFDNNFAAGDGGAIHTTNAYVDGDYNWFTNNAASVNGGALSSSGGSSISHYGTLFCHNTATIDGGAVYGLSVPASTELQYSSFLQNTASGRGGGYFEQSRAAAASGTWSSVYTSTFVNNSGGSFGAVGGLGVLNDATSARIRVEYSIFQGNGATAIRNTNPNAGPGLIVNYSDFALSTTPIAGTSSQTSVLTDSPVGSGTPRIPVPGAQLNADCFDDNLTGSQTYQTFGTNGVSHDVYFYTDTDGDGAGRMNRDCNPGDGAMWAGGTEIPGNGVDEDCLRGDDPDADADGYAGQNWNGNDCDDYDPASNPGAVDVPGNGWDDDCSGSEDSDGDNDGTSYNNDCDDADPLRANGSFEVPYDGIDYDCFDNDYDADGDLVDGTAFGGFDCDDARDEIGPSNAEIPYDGFDQNCDGLSDFDADLDGFDANDFGGTDCNDADFYTSPGAEEVPYDGIDQDCAGKNDYDADQDGYVATVYNAFAGDTAPGLNDCDDTDGNTYPNAPEITDGLDNTCDSVFNPDPDADGDGVLDNWEATFGTFADVVDSDGDGISDGDEWGGNEQAPADTDGDTAIDALDSDADGDSLPDSFEGQADHDGDSVWDFQDKDDDGDGIDSLLETDNLGPAGAPDTDADGIADWLDLDTDGDGALDVTEGTDDVDGDDIGAWRDDGSVGDGTDKMPDGPESYGFCGCTSVPTTPAVSGWLLGLGLLLARRRRA